MYEGRYPVSTALARPLIAQLVGEIAEQEGASVLAHGSTGKGNDQVRFEVTWQCLFPGMRIYAPVREWGMTRDEEIAYAEEHGIPIPVTKSSPYSLDVNLWGKSCEAGVLEDPWDRAAGGCVDLDEIPRRSARGPRRMSSSALNKACLSAWTASA